MSNELELEKENAQLRLQVFNLEQRLVMLQKMLNTILEEKL